MPIDVKYRCPACGYESNASGLCPTCDENMQKLCYCGSGKYSLQCCELIKEQPEDNEALAAAEAKAEELEETLKSAEIEEDATDEDDEEDV